MPCPKTDKCGIEGLFEKVINSANTPDQYKTLGDSLPLIRHLVCAQDDYEKCDLFHLKASNPFNSYEHWNRYEIAKANGVLSEEEKLKGAE